ncbi:MAG: phosphodiesterase [Oscillospiraceae bacterium]|nr:phosphodiesterase [Oscillospiraceae bacterium]
MKLMIASDLHGSAYYCGKMLEAYKKEEASRLLLLGDLLYHGPRNDLPRDYAPKEVLKMLNDVKEELLCVRGNCDGEVDQMVLDFPIMAEYCILELGGRTVYATHGHRLGRDNPPHLKKGDILLCGHTHIPANEDCGNFTYINPGSVSIPKNGSEHSYIVFDGDFVFKSLE